MDWLKKQLTKLEASSSKYKDEIEIIKNVQPSVYNEFHERTPLKLIFLHYVMSIYTAIISRYFEHLFYVDLFAGSGINKMKKTKDVLIGSPFIAVLNHRQKYDCFYFVEEKEGFANALEARLNTLKVTNKMVLQGDCNAVIDNILSDIASIKNKHVLFFIDPNAMEIGWKTMEKVLKMKSDIVFTFMTDQIPRAWGTGRAKPEWNSKKLDFFFGNNSWKSAKSTNDLLEIYKNNIKKVRADGIIAEVNVNMGKRFNYHVLFITRKTTGDNPWLKGILQAKTEIEQNTEAAVKMALDLITKRQKGLGDFFLR